MAGEAKISAYTETDWADQDLRAVFESKTRWTRASVFVERLVPRVAPVVYSASAAGIAALLGLAAYVPEEQRLNALTALALAALARLPYVRQASPFKTSRQDALQRLDETLGDKNFPAQMMDSDVPPTASAAQRANWAIGLNELATRTVPLLKVSAPRISRADRWITLACAAGLGASLAVAGDEAPARLSQLFDFHREPVAQLADLAPEKPLDVKAWIKPPEGIKGIKPAYLGSSANGRTIAPVHEGSTLHISVTDSNPKITVNGEDLPIKKPLSANGYTTYEYAEVHLGEGEPYRIQIEGGPSWTIPVEVDDAPQVEITAAERGWRGQISVRCIAKDKEGILSGRVVVTLPGTAEDATPARSAALPNLPVAGQDLCNRPDRFGMHLRTP